MCPNELKFLFSSCASALILNLANSLPSVSRSSLYTRAVFVPLCLVANFRSSTGWCLRNMIGSLFSVSYQLLLGLE